MTIAAAGLLLSSALLTAAITPVFAAQDCKPGSSNSACPSPKAAKSITPPKPGVTSQPRAEPKPRPEPRPVQVTAHPDAKKLAVDTQLSSQPAPRRTAHRSYASHGEVRHDYRYETEAELSQDWWLRSRREYRPPSGPIYHSGTGAMDCDYDCQYRNWMDRYRAWYDRYGRSYGADRDGVGGPTNHQDATATNQAGRYPGVRGRSLPDQSERDRLDPWHGYNSRDGLENGY